MMTYASGAAFRRALEDRLRVQSLQTGVALVRLRKLAVFDRFLARLTEDRPHAWVVKGGFALQLRLGDRARTTKDIDVLLVTPAADLHQVIVRAALQDLGDWFQFEVERPSADLGALEGGGVRLHVVGLLDGRRFETFHIDVGQGETLLEPVDMLRAPPLLEFAGIPPTEIPCFPLPQQVAEKVHAYTRPHPSGHSSRVKDLVDILLIAGLGPIDARALRRALAATFAGRGTHALPSRLPDPPSTWSTPYHRLAGEVGVEFRTLGDAGEAACRFLNPVLRAEEGGTWDPVGWSWKAPTVVHEPTDPRTGGDS
jgi:hypothetical protein